MKKLTPKKVNRIFYIFLLVGAAIGFLGVFTELYTFTIIGMITILVGTAFRLLCYCCPHCGKYLGQSTGAYCSYCGRKME